MRGKEREIKREAGSEGRGQTRDRMEIERKRGRWKRGDKERGSETYT